MKHLIINTHGGFLYGTIRNNDPKARYVEVENALDLTDDIERLSRNVKSVGLVALYGPHPDEPLGSRFPLIGMHDVACILECTEAAIKVFDR